MLKLEDSWVYAHVIRDMLPKHKHAINLVLHSVASKQQHGKKKGPALALNDY
jgi:hypothetical protein